MLTQVSSGLTVGEQVVLADMSTPLPTNTNPFAARGLTTGGGGFPGDEPVAGQLAAAQAGAAHQVADPTFHGPTAQTA